MRIIPVAGGKGGVGKSLFAANLAIALAEAGAKTIVADLDLGGSNLHSFLGLPNNYPGIGDYLKARQGTLEGLQVSTGIANLTFIPGDGQTPLMANIHYEQKRKLIRSMRKLDAEYLILDLGAGSSYNTLDFFAMSSNGIILTTPELPAIMSALVFLKNFLFRAFDRKFRKYDLVKKYLHSVTKQPMADDRLNISEIMENVGHIQAEAGEIMRQMCQSLRPRFVYNMGNDPSEFEMASRIETNLSDRLNLMPEHLGYVFEDQTVRKSINHRKSLREENPECPAAKCFDRIADRVIRRWDENIEGSLEMLRANTLKLYEKYNPEPELSRLP